MKNKSIEQIENKPLSDADIRSYLGRGTKIIEYKDLKNYNSIDELLPNEKEFAAPPFINLVFGRSQFEFSGGFGRCWPLVLGHNFNTSPQPNCPKYHIVCISERVVPRGVPKIIYIQYSQKPFGAVFIGVSRCRTNHQTIHS